MRRPVVFALSAHLREPRARVRVRSLGTALDDGRDDQLVVGLGEGLVGGQGLAGVDLLVDDESHAVNTVSPSRTVGLRAVEPAGLVVGDLELVDVRGEHAVGRDEVEAGEERLLVAGGRVDDGLAGLIEGRLGNGVVGRLGWVLVTETS